MPVSKIQEAFLYRLFNKYFKTFAVLIIITIFVLSYLFLIGPKYKDVKEARSVNLKDKVALLASRESYLEDLKNLTLNYKKISDSELEKINLVLPSGADFPDIFTEIEALAEKDGVFLSAIDISKPVVKLDKKNKLPKDIKHLDISLSFSGGDYETFKKLLDDFEYSIRTFDIKSISFTPDFTSYFIVLSAYYTE